MKSERNNESKVWPISFLVAGVAIGLLLAMSWSRVWQEAGVDKPADEVPPVTEEAMPDEPAVTAETENGNAAGATPDVEDEAKNSVIITSEAEARDYLVGQWCAEGGNTVRITVDEDMTMQFETLDASFDPPWWIDQGSTQSTLSTGGSDERPKSRVFAAVGHFRDNYSQTLLLVSIPGNQPVEKGTAIGIQTTQTELFGEYNEVYDLKDDCANYPEGGPPPSER